MKNINKLLLAAALAMAGAGSAHAATPYTYLPADPGAPGVTTLTWTVADMTSTTGPHVSGTTFDDLFVFNVPDARTVTFVIDSIGTGVNFVKGNGGFGLYGGLGGLYGGSSTVIDEQLATQKRELTGGSYSLTSGTYILEVAGTYSAANGFYAGQITGIPSAVPEPTSVLMLLAGLAGLAGVARLRKSRV